MLPFIDLAAQQKLIREKIDEGFAKVLNHGAYIMGPEVYTLEKDLSAFCGATHTLSCANGTDALALILMAKKLRPGQAVLVPSFTFAATAEVVAWFGATPIFLDIEEETYNIDPKDIAKGVKKAKQLGLKAVGLISVDLFGLPADYDAIEPACKEHDLWLLCDAAQGFGGTYKGRKIGTIGMATATSFFPAKPLGCYGDGGAVFTEDAYLLEIMQSMRIHGANKNDRYDNIHIGMNGRLDTLQAVVLIEKLKIFEDEIKARNIIAARYNQGLEKVVITPQVPAGLTSVWAQYTLRVPHKKRQPLIEHLKAKGIPTAIYYPIPLHRQQAYSRFPHIGNGLSVTDKVASEVLSLPMHPYLQEADQARIIFEIVAFLSGKG